MGNNMGRKRGVKGVMMMVVMGCDSGGVKGREGKVNLEAKNGFLESLVKIGEGFQEIFGVFGSAVGDTLGFNVVKSDDNRSKVGEHFKTIGDGLKNTKDKLDELSKQIISITNADTKGVEAAIQGSSEVIGRLINSLTKLAGAVGSISIGDNTAGAGAGSKLADEITKADSWAMIDRIKNAKTKIGNLDANASNGSGELATGTPSDANGAKAATKPI